MPQPSVDFLTERLEEGTPTFDGNQWNEHWSWNKTKLMGLSEQELSELYYKHK